jgi:lipid A 3-O-deacylase
MFGPSRGSFSMAALASSAVTLALASTCVVCPAAEADGAGEPEQAERSVLTALQPDGVFAQVGVADEAIANTVGAAWTLHLDRLRSGWGAYLEASLSRWQNRSGHPSGHGVLTQFSAIPVLRYGFAEGRSPWFVEGGIGVTVTSSLYQSGEKHFSTAFNFGDHIGLGYAFGEARQNEIALRFEHFSNAGVKHPNPGQNFVQLRFAHYFH